MDMDPAERGGVEWVSEFCPVKGSKFRPVPARPVMTWRRAVGAPATVRQGGRVPLLDKDHGGSL